MFIQTVNIAFYAHVSELGLITGDPQGRQSWVVGGRDPRFWAGGRGSRRGVVEYYYSLSCTLGMFESSDF